MTSGGANVVEITIKKYLFEDMDRHGIERAVLSLAAPCIQIVRDARAAAERASSGEIAAASAR